MRHSELVSHVSTVSYPTLEGCQYVVRILRPVFEPDTCLTPCYQSGVWRIRYTTRPRLAVTHG